MRSDLVFGYLQAELVTAKRGMTKDQLIDLLLARDAQEPRGKHPHKVLEERFAND